MALATCGTMELLHDPAGRVNRPPCRLGESSEVTNPEIAVAMVVWLSLLAAVLEGIRLISRRPAPELDERAPPPE